MQIQELDGRLERTIYSPTIQWVLVLIILDTAKGNTISLLGLSGLLSLVSCELIHVLCFVFIIKVGQFKRILGARPISESEKRSIPLVSHPRSLDLPKEFDARKAWPQCSTIGKILGESKILASCCQFPLLEIVILPFFCLSCLFCWWLLFFWTELRIKDQVISFPLYLHWLVSF